MSEVRTTWRAWRLTIEGLSLNEVARRTGINPGRLSIIERGVEPTLHEANLLRACLIAASDAVSGPEPATQR